ncbi:MAG: pantetheine-phosphate adenylyltransferase [Bacteroidales bacterium]|nr:pantetheine-phosphate adenylyltransferase [Candidatus Liminaster caballi]
MKLIFPGSFDPFTKGHESVVRRALEFADSIVIAVGYNGQKKNNGMFPTEQRVNMIHDFYANEPRIEVIAYSTLTTDIASKLGCTHILRGVRTVIDFEYERQLADVNRHLTGIETVLLFNEPAMAHITSTTVRELLTFGKDVSDFMPDGFPKLSLK